MVRERFVQDLNYSVLVKVLSICHCIYILKKPKTNFFKFLAKKYENEHFRAHSNGKLCLSTVGLIISGECLIDIHEYLRQESQPIRLRQLRMLNHTPRVHVLRPLEAGIFEPRIF